MNGLLHIQKEMVRDPSFWGIVAGNVFTIILAYSQNWPVGYILWVYWGQSVVIGLTNFVRIITLKEFTVRNLEMNETPVPENTAGKLMVGFFFLFHYGFFHYVYSVFLLGDFSEDLQPIDLFWIMVCIFGFFVSHVFSLWRNHSRDFKDKKPDLGTLMMYPYKRIIPMHITIIFGSILGGAQILLFMVLKTIADAGMHSAEHSLFQRADKD